MLYTPSNLLACIVVVEVVVLLVVIIEFIDKARKVKAIPGSQTERHAPLEGFSALNIDPRVCSFPGLKLFSNSPVAWEKDPEFCNFKKSILKILLF